MIDLTSYSGLARFINQLLLLYLNCEATLVAMLLM